jgi:hypothetical protein
LADRYPGLCGDMSVAGERRRSIRSPSLGQTTETCLTPPSARSRRGAGLSTRIFLRVAALGARFANWFSTRPSSIGNGGAMAVAGRPRRLGRIGIEPSAAALEVEADAAKSDARHLLDCRLRGRLVDAAMPRARAPSRRTASWRLPRRRRRGGAFHVASARRFPPSRSDGRSSRPSIRRSGAACPAKFQFPQMKVYSMRLATDGH